MLHAMQHPGRDAVLQTNQGIVVLLRCPLTAGSRGSILAAPQRAEMRMKASLKTLAAHLADTTPPSDEADRVLSYMGIRVSVGIVGFALPLVLFTSHFFFGSHHLPGSISAFYYTPMRNYFVGTLFALGVFLFSYRYAPRDNVLSGL